MMAPRTCPGASLPALDSQLCLFQHHSPKLTVAVLSRETIALDFFSLQILDGRLEVEDEEEASSPPPPNTKLKQEAKPQGSGRWKNMCSRCMCGISLFLLLI